MSDSPFVRRLSTSADLDDEDRSRLAALCSDVVNIPRKKDVTKEGDRPKYVHVMLRGWAARYKRCGMVLDKSWTSSFPETSAICT